MSAVRTTLFAGGLELLIGLCSTYTLVVSFLYSYQTDSLVLSVCTIEVILSSLRTTLS